MKKIATKLRVALTEKKHVCLAVRTEMLFFGYFDITSDLKHTPFTVATMFCISIIFVIYSIHSALTLNINTRPIGFFLTCMSWQIHALMSVGSFFVFVFLTFDFFVGSAWSFVFFIPATTANDLRLGRISIPDLIQYTIFLSLFLRQSQYFPFSMLSAKQRNYWYHFYNVFGMTRSLTGD